MRFSFLHKLITFYPNVAYKDIYEINSIKKQ